jgi:hypothetical protein
MLGIGKGKIPPAPKEAKPKKMDKLATGKGGKGKEVKAMKKVPPVEPEAPKKELKDKEIMVGMIDIIKANGGLEIFEAVMKMGILDVGAVKTVDKTTFYALKSNFPCKHRTGKGVDAMLCRRIVDGEWTPVKAERCKNCNVREN